MSGHFSNPEGLPVDREGIMAIQGIGLAIGSPDLMSTCLAPAERPGAVLILSVCDQLGGTGDAQLVMPTSVMSALAGALAGYRGLLPAHLRDQFDAHAADAAKRYRDNTPPGALDWMAP